jgi:hypothetical protein
LISGHTVLFIEIIQGTLGGFRDIGLDILEDGLDWGAFWHG